MNNIKKLLFGLIVFGLAACTPEPKPILYGSDACNYCRMTIVDQQHAAELVSTKGKVFMFDAIECMVHYLGEQDQDYALELVTDYLGTGQLVDAATCTYLISPNIPSPMGANLSAFSQAEQARAWQAENEGDLFTWEELKAHLQNKKTR